MFTNELTNEFKAMQALLLEEDSPILILTDDLQPWSETNTFSTPQKNNFHESLPKLNFQKIATEKPTIRQSFVNPHKDQFYANFFFQDKQLYSKQKQKIYSRPSLTLSKNFYSTGLLIDTEQSKESLSIIKRTVDEKKPTRTKIWKQSQLMPAKQMQDFNKSIGIIEKLPQKYNQDIFTTNRYTIDSCEFIRKCEDKLIKESPLLEYIQPTITKSRPRQKKFSLLLLKKQDQKKQVLLKSITNCMIQKHKLKTLKSSCISFKKLEC